MLTNKMIAKKWKGNKDLLSDFVVIPAILKSFNQKSLKKKLIYDAGCGSGRLAKQLAQRGAKVVAIDISDQMIKEAQNDGCMKNIVFKKGDILKIKSFDKKFDIVICNLVLNHFKDNEIETFLNNCYNILKKTEF
ncbi:MAG: class I SAM-dependent methyltransferase [Bacteroidales bacterium]|nr:class I SAM-dependent methyltransferase [Bacteroidales bacterium]